MKLGGVFKIFSSDLQPECHSQYVANLIPNDLIALQCFARQAPQPDAVAANPEEEPVFS